MFAKGRGAWQDAQAFFWQLSALCHDGAGSKRRNVSMAQAAQHLLSWSALCPVHFGWSQARPCPSLGSSLALPFSSCTGTLISSREGKNQISDLGLHHIKTGPAPQGPSPEVRFG